MTPDRSPSSLRDVTGEDKATREAAATERAARSSAATAASLVKKQTPEEKAKALEEAQALKADRDEKMRSAVTEFRDQSADALIARANQFVTINDLEIRAILRNAFEQGYRAGHAAGVHYGRQHP